MTETPNPNIVDADTLTGEMRPIRRCVVSIGSNLGDRLAKLQGALDSLSDTPDVAVTAVSSVYETEPVGAPEGSGSFLNAVVLLDTTLPAHVLPHPRAHERAFVLLPWAEVEPDAELPGLGPVAELAEKVGSEGVVRRD